VSAQHRSPKVGGILRFLGAYSPPHDEMLENRATSLMRSIIVISALALGFGVLAPRYLSKVGPAPAPAAQEVRTTVATPAGEARPRSVAIARNAQGHFDVDGRVNGRRIDFVVDTGASVVALTARDAARLGIHPSRNAFAADVKTANGTVRAAPARLDVVQIGSLELRDVTALVLPDDALSDNLLGLSFLSRLHRFEYSDGKLVLEQ
jgi:aspartyl protease family protein